MDFSFSELNLNSVETLPGYEARAAFTVNSASVFKEDVDIVPTIVDDTLSYVPWAATIKCRSTCSRSSRKTKHWQPANVSTPRSAMVRGCNIAPPNPQEAVLRSVRSKAAPTEIVGAVCNSVNVSSDEVFIIYQCIIIAIATATVLLAEPGCNIPLAIIVVIFLDYLYPKSTVIASEVKTT